MEKKGDNKWEKVKYCEVALKSLNNSQNITTDLLQEIINHKLVDDNWYNKIIKCYGVSQNPNTKNYLMVMDYKKDGDMRKFLQDNYDKLDFKSKIWPLKNIAEGLKLIHDRGLIHRDFHVGNIVNEITGSSKSNYGSIEEIKYHFTSYITDLGLCRSVNKNNSKSIYGVLPYVAPEVLRGKKYTPASDIYSFGIVAYELISGKPPYYEYSHDEFLAVKICQGLRPNLDTVQAAQLLKSLIERCWDANPLNRPTANELEKILYDWEHSKNTEFYQQYKEIEAEERSGFRNWLTMYRSEEKNLEDLDKKSHSTTNNKKVSLLLKIHPRAIYTSRLLNFPNLPESQNSKKINEVFYKISDELEDLRISDPVKFNEELQRRSRNLEIQKEEKSSEVILMNSEEISPIEIKGKQFQTNIEVPPK